MDDPKSQARVGPEDNCNMDPPAYRDTGLTKSDVGVTPRSNNLFVLLLTVQQDPFCWFQ